MFKFENLNLIKNCYPKQYYKQSYNVENTMKYLFFISATLFTDYFILFYTYSNGGRQMLRHVIQPRAFITHHALYPYTVINDDAYITIFQTSSP